jgi:hypothetical protein
MKSIIKHVVVVLHLERNKWLVITFALFFLLVSISLEYYIYTLPTDGWEHNTIGTNYMDFVYSYNLAGIESGLQPGDVIQSVDGKSVKGITDLEYVAPPPNWQVGKMVMVTVLRGTEFITVPVPVIHWSLATIWQYNIDNPNQYLYVLGALIISLLGGFTFFHRPNLPSAQVFFLTGTSTLVTSVFGIMPVNLSEQFDHLSIISTCFYLMAWSGLLAPSILTFTLVFPRPKQIIQKHFWLGWIPITLSLFITLLACLLNSAIMVAIAANISPLIMFVAAIGSLIHSAFTQRDATSQAQLHWAIGGFVVGLGLNLFSFLPSLGWVQNPVLAAILNDISTFGVVVTGLCLSIAVLRFHLFDIEVIIRKTLLYSALTMVLALIYFGGVVILQQLFRGISGQNSGLAVILTTLVIAALFNPLRRRLQRGIDRRFYRQKYDAAQALAKFNHTASYEVDIERLSEALIRTVNETLQPETLSLWLKGIDK